MLSNPSSEFVGSSRRRITAVGAVLLGMSLGAVTLGAQSTNFGSVPVNSSTPVIMTVPLTLVAGGTIATSSVVSQGAPNLDFTDAGTGTCAAGNSLSAGGSCTVAVNFTPRFAGTNYGAAVLFDGSGNVLATAYLQGTGMGPQAVIGLAAQTTIANASTGLNGPGGVAVDGEGNVYVTENDCVIKETFSGGAYTQSVVVSGLSAAQGMAVDGAGNLYIAESYPAALLKETPSGNGYTQSTIGSGLLDPIGVAVDGSGNLYIVSGLSEFYKETLSGGSYTQTTIATRSNDFQVVAVDASATS